MTTLNAQILGESVKHLIVLDETFFSTLSLRNLKPRREGILFVYNSLLCAALSDKGKVWLRCNRVKVINMCHRTVTFGIHSTATTKETEQRKNTRWFASWGFLLPVPCLLLTLDTGSVSAVSVRLRGGMLMDPYHIAFLSLSSSPSFSLFSSSPCYLSEGGQAINFPLVVELCI